MEPLIPVVEQLDSHCWRLINHGFSMNTGLVVGQKRAAVIDTGSGPREAASLHAAIRGITNLPLLVINTHAHGDHVFGNSYFAARGVTDFYASAEAAEHLRVSGEGERQLVRFLEPEMAGDQGDSTSIHVPDKVVPEAGTILDLGNLSAKVLNLGPGHTPGDLLVQCGQVLFTGDLVEEGGPPNFEDADPYRWVELLGRLEQEFSADVVVVPGHGNVVDRDFISRQCREMRAAIACGQEFLGSPPDGGFEATADQLDRLPYSSEQSAIFLQRLHQSML